MIRNVERDEWGDGDVGIIEISMEIHDSVADQLFGGVEEDREWHDFELEITQDIEQFECDGCDVKFDLSTMAVREIQCEEHEVRFENE